ncbi:proliferating cell nuclear antigen (pcna) [Edhazardia aedis USNM 41457]|uniref:DNA sliding clamp PCNA n=1 Tax=Edhazardia aedis (strain USNM 41457) TaxID=1003232 RepID=J9DAU4_EDHAE|nr:proliferating cell nuclear antigen (pcna) [Edhazardia aedis USNM 41457]|eukprot:EJW04886.1 proliferating cell nuclear antigen (pcna) [Edhazardia aedis USNM 41457]
MFEAEIVVQDKASKKKESSDVSKSTSDTVLLLKQILEAISDLVDECEILAGETGLSMQVMDTMHAAIVEVFISKDVFDRYRCDRPTRMGIKIKDCLKFLRSLKLDSNYKFRLVAHENGNKLTMGHECTDYDLDFDLVLFDFTKDKFEIPPQEFQVEVLMPTKSFLIVPRIVGAFEDYISLEAHNKVFSVRQESDRGTTCLSIKESDTITMKIDDDVKQEIAMKYVNSIAKAANLSETVKVCMGSNSPVFFDFTLDESGYMRFFIAPRVAPED